MGASLAYLRKAKRPGWLEQNKRGGEERRHMREVTGWRALMEEDLGVLAFSLSDRGNH